MTATEALYKFFSDFNLPAYPDTAVPSDTVMPYLTYSVSVGGWGDMANSLTVKLWYHTEKEAEPNAKAEEISRTIGRGGIQLPCDTGTVWLMRGEPWCINSTFESDQSIKLRQLNVAAIFNTI